MSPARPSAGARSELRRTIWPWSTDIPLLSADPFNLEGRLIIGDEEYVRCTGLSGSTLTGCARGISPEDGGSEAKRWPGGTSVDQVSWTTTEVVTDYPTSPTDAMVGRDFAWDAGDGNVYRYHVVRIEGTPVVIWDDEPPSSGMVFLWASLITGLTGISGVAFDASSNIYVIVGGTGERKYSAALALQWSITLGDSRHVASDGSVVFSSQTAGSIGRRSASTGAAASTYGTAGTGNNQYASPIGIVTDGTDLWIVDSGNARVQKISVGGVYASQTAIPAGSTGITLGLASTHIFTLCPGAGTIQKHLKTDLSLVSTFTLGTGTAEGQISSTAEGIAVTSDGRIWVADTGNHRINVYDSAGVFLGSLGSFGSGDSQFKSPKQLAASGTVVYVADSGNNRLVTVQEKVAGITPVITERMGSAVSVNSTGSSGDVTVTCNAGEVSIGAVLESAGRLYITKSRRSGTTGWTVNIRNDTGATTTATPGVICLQVPLV